MAISRMMQARRFATATAEKLYRTPLYQFHVDQGAKIVPFAGWEMPVQYKHGVLKEHNNTRTQASIFDVSHMGQFQLTGA